MVPYPLVFLITSGTLLPPKARSYKRTMPIIATPEVGIPLPFDTTPEELEEFRVKANAYFETISDLIKRGLPVKVTEEDKAAAHKAFASETLPAPKQTTPGAILNLEALLTEWDQEVLDVSRRLRNYVTNKLLMETTDPDPKIRLKSLELLGRVASVGLFSERIDITVTHRTINDIESELKKTLELFGENVLDVTPVESIEPVQSLATMDIDSELGLIEPVDEQRAAS